MYQHKNCCKCLMVARGRCIFLNSKDEVVDNAFCTEDFGDIIIATLKHVKKIRNDQKYNKVLIEHFTLPYLAKPLPTKKEFEVRLVEALRHDKHTEAES